MKYFIFSITVLIIFLSRISIIAQTLGEPPLLKLENIEENNLNIKARVTNINSTCNRTTVVNNYNNDYLGSTVNLSTLGWTGNVTGCIAGSISATAQDKTIQRINYYRNLVGLANITYTNSYDVQTQEAALMMKANNSLNHYPPNTWTCYTTNGYNGAGNSNLSLGAYASGAIDGYMTDAGSGNYMAGHRRWVLYSRALTFGHGSTDNSDALWVNGATGTPTNLPAFIAWPVAGYMPRNLIPQRWSFSIPNADFSAAIVSVLDENNNSVGLTVNTLANGYGDNAIVWDLTNAPTFSGSADVLYKVTVTGVKIGGVTQSPYVYNIIATDATTDATLTITSSNPNCGQGMNNATATANFPKGAKGYLWSNGATTQTITNLAPGTYTVTVTDKNDCTYSQSVTISNTVSTKPTATNDASTPNCAGSSVTLTAGNCSGTYDWSNGLGTGSTKTVSPVTTTSYTVSCTEGTCVATSTTTTVNVTTSPIVACTPTASNGVGGYFGIINFTFNSINSSSGTSSQDGNTYIDKSCYTTTTVQANNTYSISVGGYFTNVHAVKVYIDYNNNGIFTDTGETVLTGNTSGSTGGNILSGNITIPNTAVSNTLLRVRVLADVSSSSSSCNIVGNPTYKSGQIEDYGLIISNCVSSLTLTSTADDYSSGNITKQASATVSVAPNANISATNKITGVGTVVTYQAKSILLDNGFKADSGTVFKAEVGGCN